MYLCDLVKEIAERQSKVQNGILELMKWYKDEQKETSKNENKTALEISLSKDKKNENFILEVSKKTECSKEGARRCLLSLILKRIFQFSQRFQ